MWEAEVGELKSKGGPGRKHETISKKIKQKGLGESSNDRAPA
jgi:hypothetical protein